MSDEVHSARSLLATGALVVAAGLAIAGTASQTFGGFVTVGGWLALVYGIHRYGRARHKMSSKKSDSSTGL
jgi:hypothetical protein